MMPCKKEFETPDPRQVAAFLHEVPPYFCTANERASILYVVSVRIFLSYVSTQSFPICLISIQSLPPGPQLRSSLVVESLLLAMKTHSCLIALLVAHAGALWTDPQGWRAFRAGTDLQHFVTVSWYLLDSLLSKEGLTGGNSGLR